MAIDNVVFDLGGVLIDWNPRYVYRTIFDDEDAMERFLAEITTSEWNAQQDAGRSWEEAVRVLIAEHPEYEREIRAYHERWVEMLGGPIRESVDILADLRATNVRLFGLSNWSSETFAIARQLPEYEFLGWFDAVVISGDVRLVKPDPAIFRHLLEEYGLKPTHTIFVDDSPDNVDAARALRMLTIQFRDGSQLRADLKRYGLLDGVAKEASPPTMG
jgi:2-haloacid dehalogenase